MMSRLIATLIGGAAGALTALAWYLSRMITPSSPPNHAMFTMLAWGAAIGAIVGVIGGLSPARWLWEQAVGDVRDESNFALAIVVFLVGVIALVVIGVRLSSS